MMNKNILTATKESRLLSFTYKGERRVVEPHKVGMDKGGGLKLSAYQIEPSPGWRLFYVEGAERIGLRKATFTPRPEFKSGADSQIETVIEEVAC